MIQHHRRLCLPVEEPSRTRFAFHERSLWCGQLALVGRRPFFHDFWVRCLWKQSSAANCALEWLQLIFLRVRNVVFDYSFAAEWVAKLSALDEPECWCRYDLNICTSLLSIVLYIVTIISPPLYPLHSPDHTAMIDLTSGVSGGNMWSSNVLLGGPTM